MRQTMKDPKVPHRLSYFLRLWRSEGLRDSGWRASLEIPETGKRIGFTSLEQLFAYLMDVIESKGDMQEKEVQK
jgi:hypothetical protein